MNKNNIINSQLEYVVPTLTVMNFESEGVLCGSDVTGDGFGAGGFDPDPDMPEINF